MKFVSLKLLFSFVFIVASFGCAKNRSSQEKFAEICSTEIQLEEGSENPISDEQLTQYTAESTDSKEVCEEVSESPNEESGDLIDHNLVEDNEEMENDLALLTKTFPSSQDSRLIKISPNKISEKIFLKTKNSFYRIK